MTLRHPAHNRHYFMYVDNKPWAWRMAEGFSVQVISNSTLSVDTYFFLSGFLLAYLYLKHTMDHKGHTKPINYSMKLNEFFLTVLKRFIRYVSRYNLIHAGKRMKAMAQRFYD